MKSHDRLRKTWLLYRQVDNHRAFIKLVTGAIKFRYHHRCDNSFRFLGLYDSATSFSVSLFRICTSVEPKNALGYIKSVSYITPH